MSSLLNNSMTECVIVDRITVDDDYGGLKPKWQDGAHIQCAIVPNNSIQAQIAQKQGVSEFYTITTQKSINLQFHDIIRRLDDGKIFRITSNGNDTKTPKTASLNMRQVTAENYELTDEVGNNE